METKVRDFFIALSIEKGGEDLYQLSAANFYALGETGGYRHLMKNPDIYDGLLILPYSVTLNNDDYALVIETTGWAAPHDGQEIAPSEHPLRRRVRLLAMVTRTYEMASALGFADDTDEIVTDDGHATGGLADALIETMRALNS
ncbi:MAG: hypothetical protein EBU84_02035 [Actinobacteria bacterium]|jgi:hypothetical protein|nr:hypothetical protein [Actinomycetota bacterium]